MNSPSEPDDGTVARPNSAPSDGTVIRPGSAPSAPPTDVTVARDSGTDADDPNRTSARPGDAGDAGDALGTVARSPAAPGPQTSGPTFGPHVPGYEVLGELGRGGMGVVYRARDTRLNREVALKSILRADADRATVARFWAEAEVLAAVRHPHVVQVFELGEHEGRPYMAMELLTSALDATLKRGALAPRAAAELMAKIAAGVAAAHDLGIVHRDLKPGNVLLDATGEPKVTDFGLAKRRSHDLTQTGALMGTPAYMAPEQAVQAKFVGPPADVWALGVMLYEFVAGTRPFTGETVAALLSRISSAEPVPLRTAAKGVPRDLETVVAKCLAKEPQHRYPSAAELAADLTRFARGEPIAARPVGPLERAARWARRKPALASAYALSALAALLVAASSTVTWFWYAAEGARADAEGARDQLAVEKRATEKARDAADDARAAEAAARRKLAVVEYGRTVQLALQAWRDTNLPTALALLNGTPEHLRGWEWRYVHRLCHGSLADIPGHRGIVWGVAFSPDGARVATAAGDRTARVWDAATGTELLVLRHPDDVQTAAFAPDGTALLTACLNGATGLWDALTGARRLLVQGASGAIDSTAFAPDGSRVVLALRDGTARVYDARTGAEALVLRGPNKLSSARFAADGFTLVTGDEGSVRVWHAVTGEELTSHESAPHVVGRDRFSPNRAQYFNRNAMTLHDSRTGNVRFALTGATTGVLCDAFSPDGTRLAAGGYDTVAHVWNATTGKQLLALRGHEHAVQALAFSADGARLITGSMDGTAKMWSALPGLDRLALGRARAEGVAFAPDGATLAIDGWNPELYDARTGRVLPPVKGGPKWAGPGRAVAYDGTRARALVIEIGPDKRVAGCDAATGREQVVLAVPKGAVRGAFAPSGDRVAVTFTDGAARVYDARTGAEVLAVSGHTGTVNALAFDATGARFVTCGADGVAKVWDARTGAELATLRGHTRAYDPRTKSGIGLFTRGSAAVTGAAFSPDGSRVVTGSEDGTARLWHAETGAELLALRAEAGAVTAVAFDPTGARIAAGTDAGAALWDSTPVNRALLPKDVAPAPRSVRH